MCTVQVLVLYCTARTEYTTVGYLLSSYRCTLYVGQYRTFQLTTVSGIIRSGSVSHPPDSQSAVAALHQPLSLLLLLHRLASPYSFLSPVVVPNNGCGLISIPSPFLSNPSKVNTEKSSFAYRFPDSLTHYLLPFRLQSFGHSFIHSPTHSFRLNFLTTSVQHTVRRLRQRNHNGC